MYICLSIKMYVCRYDQTNKRLALAALPNQDPLQASTGLVPLLGIDVSVHSAQSVRRFRATRLELGSLSQSVSLYRATRLVLG